MNASQLTDYKRLQKIICDLKSEDKTGYYTRDNDLIPDTDNVYTLGDSNHRFHSLYVGPGTIYMGDSGQSEISVNRCNVLLCKPGLAAPYIEFTNSNFPNETDSVRAGIHVYYNVACNDLWKRYPDGSNAPFGTVRGETGPRGPEWVFSNTLVPTQGGLNIGSAAYNVSNLYLSNSLILNTIPITAGGGFVSISGVPIATRTDITNGVSSLSSIVSYGLSTIYSPYGISSLSSIVSYGLSTVYSPYGVSSLSSIVSYGLSTVAAQPHTGVSSLSSIVSYGLSTVYSPYGVSSLSSIVSYGLSTVYSPYGVSSLSSIISYGLSSVLGTGNSAGISSLSSVVSYGLSSIINSNTLQPLLGGVLRVDQLYGNDALAATNNNKYQIAFKTIGAAMALAQPKECVYILPGIYNEKIVFSNNVAIRGINTTSVTIQQINCTEPTTLVTLAQNNRIEDVTLTLTSSHSNATPLIGALLSNNPNPVTSTKMRGIVINVDNSAMTCNVATTVYGIYATGNSSVLPLSADDLQRSTVNVTSSGPGAKRGIYNDGSNGFRMRDVNVFCKDNPAYSLTSGGTYYGIETSNVNALISAKSSTVYGYAAVAGNNAADMSQTLGTISLAGTDLPNRTGNGKGFTNSTAQPSIPFGIGGTPGNYNYTYLMPGSLPEGNHQLINPYGIRTPTISMFDQMAFQAVSLPEGTTYAYLFKNGVIQPSFTLSLTYGGALYTNTSNVTLTMTTQDNYSIMLSNGTSLNNTHDLSYPLVTISFY